MIRIVVYHGQVCDTGCCGHYIEVSHIEAPAWSNNWRKQAIRTDQTFEHQNFYDENTDPIAFAKKVIQEETDCDPETLDWEKCLVVAEGECWNYDFPVHRITVESKQDL